MLDNSILLVEDNWDDEELIKRELRLHHVLNEVIAVRDGEEALDYLVGWGYYRGRDTSVLPGLVLLDLQLPRVSGFDVLRQLLVTPLTDRLSIVVISGAEPNCNERVMQLGAKGLLEKPVQFSALQQVVRPLGFQWLRMDTQPDWPYLDLVDADASASSA